ncbi:hypothetical protein IMG5_194630 [Ichthyophthirius multifiliis]|uniref:AP complex subunit beta n=1 Tax=Ichthyophthirius multifiliis TaxID=5932 RepID=G0R4S6_ICHMU|nr:hypothetical protein IMG5_194630 [Ichthyophthirius multifiliis]EGR27514.1 hypothetical protein IMG5_194630 [Ichthyophthirius multifiliis]|eukprot:XP_004024949.1 hypothetical protein IMG5_194630 [Ichthyophthirius multifiliis]
MSYFNNEGGKGELYDLEYELKSNDFQVKLNAIKKVIANMTVGKDVSALFQPVIKCLEYPDIKLKKLVYLYIINYSREKPDDAIMVINLFRKDMDNKANPLLRALAVRTIGCLRVHKLNEYLVVPLKNSLNDQEPYVRKTAALCVPKVYEVSPQIVEQAGLIDMMQCLLQKESNGLVLANLLISLQEISFLKKQQLVMITSENLIKILLALNECVEWGQILILDQLVDFKATEEEAEKIIERVLPRLNHINPAVVLSAIKVIVKFLDQIDNIQIVNGIQKKLTPPLISLLTWDKPEVKYIILKVIIHILQKRPLILENQLKSFFCFYNEPYYVKNEKLSILVKICNEQNLDILLNELQCYVTEPDTEFVKRSIIAIGNIAIKFNKACNKAFQIIIDIIKNILLSTNKSAGSEYIQEILITLQKVFRKHRVINNQNKNDMELITKIIPQAFDQSAKAAAAWILGEYAEYIPNSLQILEKMTGNFLQEQRKVQLDLLSTAVKIFVKYPNECKDLIIHVLQVAAEETDNSDVRDRAYMYWRMLSQNPQKTKDTVLCSKPKIEENKIIKDVDFLQKMIHTIPCVSSILQKDPEQLFKHEIIIDRKIKTKNLIIIMIYNVDNQNIQQITQAQPQFNQEFDMFGDPIIKNETFSQIFTEIPTEEVLKFDQKGTSGQSGLRILANFSRENDDIYINIILLLFVQNYW